MAYGETMRKLSPCGSALVLSLLREACPAPGDLLDAGCGRGERLADCARALPDTRCCGIDCDADNAEQARANCPGAEIVCGDVRALPWPDASFDAALCECTLSLLRAPERGLAELGRVLRPGGALLLSDLVSGAHAPVCEELSRTGAVRYLASCAWIEHAASDAGFAIQRYRDCREEYLTMAAQLIFDCDGEGCIAPETFAALRAKKAGYGLWILKKKEAGPAPRKIGAVVAAAGLSSRMGDFKPLLPFDGSTVIERCIANLRDAGAAQIVVVTGHRGGELAKRLEGSGVRCVHNPDYTRTQMFDSLRIGLRALPADIETVLLTPGDVPLVRPETIRALLETRGGFVCPVCAGRRGHPVALDAKYLPALLEYDGGGGLRGAVAALGIPVTETEVADGGMLRDLDTPEDYRAVLELLEREQ